MVSAIRTSIYSCGQAERLQAPWTAVRLVLAQEPDDLVLFRLQLEVTAGFCQPLGAIRRRMAHVSTAERAAW